MKLMHVASPNKSTRKASAKQGISLRSVQRMLKKLKLKLYCLFLLLALHEGDVIENCIFGNNGGQSLKTNKQGLCLLI